MKNNKRLVVFFILLSSFCLNAQNKKEIKLPLLIVKEEKLLTLLDSIVIHEKKCDYYRDDLLFSISLEKTKKDGTVYVIIESIKTINIDPKGYFYYKKHLFVTNGEGLLNLFFITKDKKGFTAETNFKPLIHNDSFSQWSFWYYNNNFILDALSTYCK